MVPTEERGHPVYGGRTELLRAMQRAYQDGYLAAMTDQQQPRRHGQRALPMAFAVGEDYRLRQSDGRARHSPSALAVSAEARRRSGGGRHWLDRGLHDEGET